jgi:RNA polymerase sigma-70 factor (ECF subfamily)
MQNEMNTLAARAQDGDADAFGALLDAHYDLIYRLSFRMLGTQFAAEDLTQDICLALPVKLQSFRGDAKFSTWLTRVVLNAAKDQLRKRNRRHSANAEWGDTEVLNRAANDETRDQLSWLTRAMNHLSDDLRDTLTLILGEEMTHAQVGEILGLSEGTISWRLSEAKKQLRALAKSEGSIS